MRYISRRKSRISLGSVHDALDRANHALELPGLRCELLPSRARKRVITSPAVILRHAPFGFDPSVQQQALERGVERAFPDVQHVFGDAFQMLGDAVAVVRTRNEGLEDQHVKSAWQ